jgi:hypothetical protein
VKVARPTKNLTVRTKIRQEPFYLPLVQPLPSEGEDSPHFASLSLAPKKSPYFLSRFQKSLYGMFVALLTADSDTDERR